jgi:hypothetical protein
MSDGEIIARVDHIAGALLMAATVATARDDQAWMEQYPWFAEAIERLFNDKPAVAFDG